MSDRIDFIKDLKPHIKQLNLTAIVLEVSGRYFTKDGHEIRSVKMADRTGSINVCLYDELGSYIQPGDICQLTRCYTSIYKGQLTVYTGRIGKIAKISDFCMTFSETPNMSEPDPTHPLSQINS